MKNLKKLWICLLTSVSIYFICWCILGIPSSLFFRRLTGLAQTLWAIEDLTINNLKSFLFISRTFLCFSFLSILAYIATMLWGYRNNVKHLYTFIVIGSLLTAQIMTGTLTAFYPHLSGLILLFPTGTEYSHDFTVKSFSELYVGMEKAEIEQRIGRGFEQYRGSPVPYDSSTWYYSQPREFAENYWKYWIHFEVDKVSQIDIEFWMD